jgi:hypothetical protein
MKFHAYTWFYNKRRLRIIAEEKPNRYQIFKMIIENNASAPICGKHNPQAITRPQKLDSHNQKNTLYSTIKGAECN